MFALFRNQKISSSGCRKGEILVFFWQKLKTMMEFGSTTLSSNDYDLLTMMILIWMNLTDDVLCNWIHWPNSHNYMALQVFQENRIVLIFKVINNANVCETDSKCYISSIQSSLTVPNSFPFSLEHLIYLLNIEDLLIKTSVCLCEYETRYTDVIYRRIRSKSN